MGRAKRSLKWTQPRLIVKLILLLMDVQKQISPKTVVEQSLTKKTTLRAKRSLKWPQPRLIVKLILLHANRKWRKLQLAVEQYCWKQVAESQQNRKWRPRPKLQQQISKKTAVARSLTKQTKLRAKRSLKWTQPRLIVKLILLRANRKWRELRRMLKLK